MDGSKIITGILFAGITLLAITACKVQPFAYINLYIDNSTAVNNTLDSVEVLVNNLEDTTLVQLIDSSTIGVPELPVILHPAKDTFKPSSDSIYQQEAKKMLKILNDTIQLMHRKVNELQNSSSIKRDTIYIEKQTKELKPSKETVVKQKATELELMQDTTSLLDTRVPSLAEQMLPGKDTLDGQPLKVVQQKSINDTIILLIAFYEGEEIKPLDEDSLLKQINELFLNKNVTRITLSGYSDTLGGEILNNEITKKRLNYLSQKLTPLIAKEKVFVQKFGDAYASDMAVNDERRIEIKIQTK